MGGGDAGRGLLFKEILIVPPPSAPTRIPHEPKKGFLEKLFPTRCCDDKALHHSSPLASCPAVSSPARTHLPPISPRGGEASQASGVAASETAAGGSPSHGSGATLTSKSLQDHASLPILGEMPMFLRGDEELANQFFAEKAKLASGRRQNWSQVMRRDRLKNARRRAQLRSRNEATELELKHSRELHESASDNSSEEFADFGLGDEEDEEYSAGGLGMGHRHSFLSHGNGSGLSLSSGDRACLTGAGGGASGSGGANAAGGGGGGAAAGPPGGGKGVATAANKSPRKRSTARLMDEVGGKRGSLLSGLRLKTSARQRLQRMSTFRRTQQGGQSMCESWSQENDQEPFLLSVDQQARLREAFSRYDIDRSGSLDPAELRLAVADLGLAPRSHEEKVYFKDALVRFGKNVEEDGSGELVFPEFEAVVSELMRYFSDVMRVELKEQFDIHRIDSSQQLALDQALVILGHLNLQPRTRDERMLVKATIEEANSLGKRSSSDSKPQGLTAASFFSVMTDLASTAGESSSAAAAAAKPDWEKAFLRIREGLGAMRRDRLRRLLEQRSVRSDVAEALGDELCEMQDQFIAVCHPEESFEESATEAEDDDFMEQLGAASSPQSEPQPQPQKPSPSRPSTLTVQEFAVFLADRGLRPTSRQQMQLISARSHFIAQTCKNQLTFPHALGIILYARFVAQEERKDALKKTFAFFDKDRSGSLSRQECSLMLAKMGFSPRSRAEQRLMAGILEAIDVDGSGDYSLSEVEVLLQRVSEMLGRQQRKAELSMAKELGLTAQEVEMQYELFRTLDRSDKNCLQVEELRRLADIARAAVSAEQLSSMMGQVDVNGSGVVEFNEFLQFMSLLEKFAKRSLLRPIGAPLVTI